MKEKLPWEEGLRKVGVRDCEAKGYICERKGKERMFGTRMGAKVKKEWGQIAPEIGHRVESTKVIGSKRKKSAE